MCHPFRTLLSAAADDSGQAQYLFEEEVAENLLANFNEYNLHHIVCVGTPTLFFDLLQQTKPDGSLASCFLLDIDHRLAPFCPLGTFAQYNVFNGHVFDTNQKADVLQKLHQADALIFDPPFGAHPQLLNHTLHQLSQHAQCPIFLFMPYFNEVNGVDVSWLPPYWYRNNF